MSDSKEQFKIAAARAAELIVAEDEQVLLCLTMKLVNGTRSPDLIRSMIQRHKATLSAEKRGA